MLQPLNYIDFLQSMFDLRSIVMKELKKNTKN